MKRKVEAKKTKIRDFFTIPNILCYIRFALIPLFVYLYINAESTRDYYMAAAVILISGLTDFADGFIARKFNQITEVGKFIDPLADKLTQAALILTLMFKIKWMEILVVIFIIKEAFMAINGAVLLVKKGVKLDGAMWFGKVSTAVFYAVMFILILLPGLSTVWVNILMGITGFFLILSFAMYIPVFMQMYKK